MHMYTWREMLMCSHRETLVHTNTGRVAHAHRRRMCIWGDTHKQNNNSRQLKEASGLQALLIMGDFNYPNICWESNAVVNKHSKRFLECIEDNFLMQLLDVLTRSGALLDLLLTNKEDLLRDVTVNGSSGCSDHKITEFEILRGMRKTSSRIKTLDFRRADFDLFKELL